MRVWVIERGVWGKEHLVGVGMKRIRHDAAQLIEVKGFLDQGHDELECSGDFSATYTLLYG